MKIRQITLGNVRRFGGKKASLGPFGDGITSIIAPNESGKSTFFDAMNALLFCGHTTTAGDVRSLQPYSGGGVEISADIEIDGELIRIEKRFISRKMAQVSDIASGRVLAREGEAEAWIKARITDAMQGPAGLLWVRQGVMGVEPEGAGPTERRQLKEARQELMSSVAGQIDAVTGGRRMDAIMRRCQEALDILATSQLRPKANGPWAIQEQKVAELVARKEELTRQVRDLGQALVDKRRLEAELGAIDDPAREKKRDEDIQSARERLDRADAAEREIENAARDIQLKRLEASRLGEEIARFEDDIRKRRALDREIETQQQAFDEVEKKVREAEALVECRKVALAKAGDEKDRIQALLQKGRRQLEMGKARARLDELLEIEDKLSGFERQASEAQKGLSDIRITEEDLERIEGLEERRRGAQSRREAGAAQMELLADAGCGATWGEVDLPSGKPIPILEEMRIALPGFGHLVVAPAAGKDGEDDPERLAGEIASCLSDCGASTLVEARSMIRKAQGLRADEKAARAGISAVAREGADQLRSDIAALKARIADAGDEVETGGETQDVNDLEVQFDGAERAVASAREDLDKAYDARSRAREEKTGCATSLRIARTQREELGDVSIDPESLELQRKDLERRRREIEADETALEARRAEQVDRSLLDSELERLMTARDNAARDRDRLRGEINQIEGLILARAEAGVEEKLGETEGELAQAQARAERYQAEVRALSTLKNSLEASRAAAREAYFEPVKQELRPLLGMLHGSADFDMDSDSMLVSRITRNGVEDGVESLSGGTAEQIAILTRLAFARLYQKDGRHVPVLLDDALVHSDDERISTMFTLLTHVAREQQIIVFSCRNRAFSDLGGARARIEVEAMA